MAQIDVARDRDEVLVERTGFRLSWGAIFAGFVVATALQMVLSTLGAAIGLVSFDPGAGDSASGLGIGVAIWFALTAIISLYIGGLTTGRLAGILTKGDGRLHGVIMWSLSTLLALYFASVGFGRIFGGVFDLVTQTTAAAAGAAVNTVGQVGSAAIGQAGNIDVDALQREVERTLAQTGNPALQPDSLQAQIENARGATTAGESNEEVAQDIAKRIGRTAGQVDRQDVINVITARTGMSQAEAEQAASRIETAAADARSQISSTAQNVGETAGEVAGDAANAASKALWAALLVMGLSVLAAVFGASQTARE